MRGRTAINASVKIGAPNRANIFVFVAILALAQIASQSGQYMNACTPLLIEKYNWDTTAKADLNESLINTVPAIGTIIGSGFGSVLMQRGRAKAFIFSLLVGIFGGLFTLIENYPLFLAAKFVVGASIGM